MPERCSASKPNREAGPRKFVSGDERIIRGRNRNRGSRQPDRGHLLNTMNYTFWRKMFGGLLMILGALALVTPFTPGSWLIFIGAEILGIGLLTRANVLLVYQKTKERIREWMRRRDVQDE